MPWFETGEPAEATFAGDNLKISPWPAPNGPRIDTRFRFNYGQYLPAPRPSHFFIRIKLESGPDPTIYNATAKLLASSNTLLEGTTGISVDGLEVVFQIELFEFPVVEPFFGTSGIRYRLILKKSGFPDFVWNQFYNRVEDGGGIYVPLLQDKKWGSSDPGQYSNFDPLVFTYITITPPYNIYEWWPISECMVFDVEPEEGFCECNGVDSYVLFNTFFPLVATRFKMEFEIRRTGADTQLVAFGYTGFGSFFYGFNDHHNFQWWNQTFFLPDGLVLVDWNHVRIEYDWSIPGGSYSIWIDDVLQITQAGTFATWVWDEIGRRGNLIAGSFDIKNVKLWDGTPGSPNLLIDVPLTGDACAVAPPTIKGTTFNMMLPSCP
jgi:hypothetical protein